MIITAHIDRAALRSDKFSIDNRFVFCELLCDSCKTSLKFLISTLSSKSLCPIERKVEVASTIVNLTNLASR